jgi:DNA-binding MarR family transcriptional regulator
MATAKQRREVAEALYALGTAVVRRIPREVSLTAISTMAALDRTGPRRTTELAALQGVAQPSMTSLINTLEKAGYVERRADPSDGRAALVALTASGEQTLRERRAAGTESVAELVDRLTDDERAELTRLLPLLRRLREVDQGERDGIESSPSPV